MELLHFPSPAQAINYLILCLVSVLGVIQVSAARANRRDLLWFDDRASLMVGAVMIPASFIWFFVADKEIFVPGLAGSEIIAIFLAAFFAAAPLSRAIAFVLARARASTTSRVERAEESTL